METVRHEIHDNIQAPEAVTSLVNEAQKYTLEYLQSSRCRYLPFHNAQHTWEVFLNVSLLGTQERISPQDLEPVLLAALFHDLGNATRFEGHERLGMALAENFLSKRGYPSDSTEIVLGCIQATQMPQAPQNPFECLHCYADLFHLGTADFMIKNAALRKEWRDYQEQEFSDAEWYRLNRAFLERHTYFTDYGRRILKAGKAENIERLYQQQHETYA